MQFPVNVNNDGTVNLGTGANIDAGVVLGYLPGRPVDQVLTIGPNARIRQGTIIYTCSRIGANLETGHNVVIREENIIGNNLNIWSNSVIDYGCKIGGNVKIHNKVYVGQYTIIEDDVLLSPGVTLGSEMHPGCPNSRDCMRGPCINKGAKIGINCTILPRVVIGEHSLIGAGSVVTRDIPAGVVAYGNPAQVMCDVGDLTCLSGLRAKPYEHLMERI